MKPGIAHLQGELYRDYLVPEPITCEFMKGGWSAKVKEVADPALAKYLSAKNAEKTHTS